MLRWKSSLLWSCVLKSKVVWKSQSNLPPLPWGIANNRLLQELKVLFNSPSLTKLMQLVGTIFHSAKSEVFHLSIVFVKVRFRWRLNVYPTDLFSSCWYICSDNQLHRFPTEVISGKIIPCERTGGPGSQAYWKSASYSSKSSLGKIELDIIVFFFVFQ